MNKKGSGLEFLKDAGDRLNRWTDRWIPDALVIVFILSAIAFGMAIIWGGVTPYGAVQAWGKGFWRLLEFAMQMCLIIMTGYILAVSPPMKVLLDKLSSITNPDKPWQAILTMALFSMIVAWFNWGLSLIGSAMFALFLIKRNPKTDYRLLIASAYLGLGCTWHSGLSGSATLIVATPDNFLIKDGILADVIPTSTTIFSPFNLVLTVIMVAIVALVMAAMHPRPEKTYRIKPELLDRLKLYEPPRKPDGPCSPSSWMNWWPGFNIMVAAAGATWLFWYFFSRGGGLTLNVVNFIFLMLGVIFHWRPRSFLKASEEAGKTVWAIIIQFPFYAGIFGLFKYTALSSVFVKAFVAVSTPGTYLLFVYWYAGLLNYLVPSGGSEWAITAPYLLPAAGQLGIESWKTVIAYAWGDMMTDMIQPFWAIAMLAVAKLEFREIMGWLLIVFFIFFVLTSIAFLLLPFV
ncbi:MAG: TIGR00366 family protein [Candidatus Tritonobacter lacicola]|nr:TIGR00366 family protein [Candidatus Tritonobacter lacicola]